MGGEGETDRGTEKKNIGSKDEVELNGKGERERGRGINEERTETEGRGGSDVKDQGFPDVQIASHIHSAPLSSRIAAGTSLAQPKRASLPLKKAPADSFSFTSSEDEVPNDKGKQHQRQHYQQEQIYQ